MIRQLSRRARLEVELEDNKELQVLKEILEGTASIATLDSPPLPLSSQEQAEFWQQGAIKLERIDYERIIHYLMSIGLPHHSIYDLPLNRVLRRNDCFTDLVRRPTQVKYEGRTYSCKKSHVGNSAIQYKNPQTGTLETGFIGNIICAPVDGALRTFIFVNPNKALPPAVENIAPFVRFHPNIKSAYTRLFKRSCLW